MDSIERGRCRRDGRRPDRRWEVLGGDALSMVRCVIAELSEGLYPLITRIAMDALFLAGAPPDRMTQASSKALRRVRTPGIGARRVSLALSSLMPLASVVVRVERPCDLEAEGKRGTRLIYLVGMLKIGVLAFEHGPRGRIERAWERCRRLGCGYRRRRSDGGYADSLRMLRPRCRSPEALNSFAALGRLDPDGWRPAMIDVLEFAQGPDRCISWRLCLTLRTSPQSRH